MPARGELSIKIYDVRGQLIRTLVDGVTDAGSGRVVWEGTDQGNNQVASGVYFAITEAFGTRHIEKLALVK